MSFQLTVVGKTWTGILLALGAGAITAIFSIQHARAPETRTLQVTPAAAVSSPDEDVPLPPAERSDSQVRDTLVPLSPRTIYQDWLGADHLLERLSATIVAVASDESPIRHIPISGLRHPFCVTRAGSALAISDRSYARYDFFANVIASLDERKVAAAYRALHPLLEGAYHLLGYPGKPLDRVTARALRRIANAPVHDEVRVRQAGTLYFFEDPALEALGPVEKQFLRMGPRNTQLLKDSAREIAAALGMSLEAKPALVGSR
jgi:Protein of unknown function (DUF3014)